jgi:hypothetical protein
MTDETDESWLRVQGEMPAGDFARKYEKQIVRQVAKALQI